MLSRRSRIAGGPNRISTRVEAARKAGLVHLDLTASNPTRAGLPYPVDLLEPLSDARGLHYDPAPQGLLSARVALSDHHRSLGHLVAPDDIWLTSSTSEAYAILFKLLCDPGDEVLVPAPGYPLFDHLARLEGVAARAYPLGYDGRWHLDMDSIRRAIGPRTRAIVVVNPNNPTGSFLKRDELEALVSLGLPLISDEVFAPYALDGDPTRTSALHGQGVPVFVLQGLSKALGLPQLKLSWIALGGDAMHDRELRHRLDMICDCYLSVATPVQLALPDLLVRAEPITAAIRARLGENRHSLVRLSSHSSDPAEGSPLTALHVEGGWYGILRVPATLSEQAWVLACLEAGVLVQPGFFYDFQSEAFLVLSLLAAPNVFRDGLAQIDRVVRQHVHT